MRALELVLPAGEKVTGRVLDPDGAPLMSVEVGLSREGDGPRRVSRTRTDEAGEFRITGLEPGAYTLTARHWGPWPGHPAGIELAPYRSAGYEPDGLPVEIRLEAEAFAIEGRVEQADGSALEYAFVYVDRGLALPDKGVLTDAHGRFRLSLPEPGAIDLRARRTRHLSQTTGELTRLEVLLQRELLPAAEGEARADGVLPDQGEIVLRLGR